MESENQSVQDQEMYSEESSARNPLAIDLGLLIETIQNYEYLYNIGDSKYKNQKLKARAWQEIAEVFNTTVEECQKAWKSLRDKFVKEKNKNKASGSEACESSWEYFEKMFFYAKHSKPRRTFTNVTAQKIQDEGEGSSRPSSSCSVWSAMETIVSPTLLSDEELKPGPSKALSGKTPTTSREGPPIKKRKQNPPEVAEVLETAKTICKSLQVEKTKANVNSIFGQYVASRLDEMDPEEAKAKRRQMLMILEED